MPTLADLLVALDARFPFARAESWDKTGLLVGERSAEVRRVLVCYEVTNAALDLAQESGCEAVVAYHPLIFKALEKLDFADRTAHLCARLIRQNQGLICTHTALDGAAPPGALGDALAAQLGLVGARVHHPSGAQKLVGITYFIPPEQLESTRNAAWEAGAGKVGNYDECSALSNNLGTFRPLPGARPSVGAIGTREEAQEVRVELIAPEDRFPAVIAAIQGASKSAGGYEEVAYFVTPLLNRDVNQGYGPLRIASVPSASVDEWSARARSSLHAPSLRIARPDAPTRFDHVACSPGSGAGFIASLPRGTIFISGDFKHHDALLALHRGVALIDVTHAATETASIAFMASALAPLAGLEVVKEAPRNPFE